MLRKLLKSQKGATAIEYGLISALIAVGCIAGMGQLGSKLNSSMYNTAGKL
jgi:pilus assembly protein Flp/PilA